MPVVSQDSSTGHSPSTVLNLGVTFREQSQRWLEDLATRKRKPIAPSSLRAFGSYVRRLLPIVGPDTRLESLNNGAAKQIVAKLCDQGLAPKTVNEILATLKAVIASAVDSETGEQLFPRSWSAKHIDCPTIGKQRQPCLSVKELETSIMDAASNQERVLYCVLAGSGLRIAEALAIHVSGAPDQTSWSPETGAIDVRSSIFNGRELPRLKTVAARRTVDLDPRLKDFMAKFVAISGIQSGDYLFRARSGRPMHVKTARQRLAKRDIPGFHTFRRFYITRRREMGMPEDLIRYAAGHSGRGITDRYSKLGECLDLRRDWARKVGLGFELPELRDAPLRCGTKSATPPSPVASPAPAETAYVSTEPHKQPYSAVDSDLDEFFYTTPELVTEEV